MKGKVLQLVGIIAYVILALISIFGWSSSLDLEYSILYFLSIFSYLVLFQIGIVFLILNYLNTDKDSLRNITLATIMRFICIFPMIFIALFTFSHYILYIEIVAKTILGIYNIVITRYVLSKKEIIKKLISKIKANKNVTVISKYEENESSNTITLVYKTIDGISIGDIEKSLQSIDPNYKINLININDIKDKAKYDDIMQNSENIYNDGRYIITQ